jgi:hypothetical protein
MSNKAPKGGAELPEDDAPVQKYTLLMPAFIDGKFVDAGQEVTPSEGILGDLVAAGAVVIEIEQSIADSE